MAKTLYLGNLSWSTTEEEIVRRFSEVASVVACRIVTDRETGRSRGFGFVEVEDADAEKAVESFNGTEFDGRRIIVDVARPRAMR